MNQFGSIAKSLVESLQLRVAPTAVCFSEEKPEGVSAPAEPAAAGCVFWERGAAGAFVTTPADHANCAIGMYTHHMPLGATSQADLGACLKVFDQLGYASPQDVAAIPVLMQEPKYVTYAPLASTPAPPAVVLVFANARQSLAITEAVQQVDPSIPPALGRPACAVIPQAFNTNRPAMSLGCCGARAYLNVLTDDYALWALPGSRISEYAGRIEALARANQILTQFHTLRRRDIEAGKHPSIKESLARLEGK